MKRKTQWYVGHTGFKLVAFASATIPTLAEYGDRFGYGAVTGPFKTKRGAKWAEQYGQNNPHFQHVNDAERIAKQARTK